MLTYAGTGVLVATSRTRANVACARHPQHARQHHTPTDPGTSVPLPCYFIFTSYYFSVLLHFYSILLEHYCGVPSVDLLDWYKSTNVQILAQLLRFAPRALWYKSTNTNWYKSTNTDAATAPRTRALVVQIPTGTKVQILTQLLRLVACAGPPDDVRACLHVC
jgi:hypothetical protein